MGLFKKKVGGTKVGNLIRGIAFQASGGILGTGAGILQPPNVSPLAPAQPTYSPPYIAENVSFMDKAKNILNNGFPVDAKVNTGSILTIGVVLITIIYFFFKMKRE